MFDVQQLRQAFRPHDRLTIWEQEVVFLIALEATQRGGSVSIRDEAYEQILGLRKDPQLILDHAGHTSEDYLLVHGPLGDRLGWIRLVYGNEPGVTVADHTAPALDEVRVYDHSPTFTAILDLVDKLQAVQSDCYFQIA